MLKDQVTKSSPPLLGILLAIATICWIVGMAGARPVVTAPALEIHPAPQDVPLNLFDLPVGSAGTIRFDLPADISAYSTVLLLLHVNDVDAAREASLFLNNVGPLPWPDSIIGEGEHGGVITLDVGDLRPGSNQLKFTFEDNLNGTTAGCSILQVKLQLFIECSSATLARIVQEATYWGSPADWTTPVPGLTVPTPPPHMAPESPAVTELFLSDPLTRWDGLGGAWRKTSEKIELYNIQQRDIYHSSQESGYVGGVHLWREQDNTIKCRFGQIAGDIGLVPTHDASYRCDWLGIWPSVIQNERTPSKPESSAGIKCERITLSTHDYGDTWENLGKDQQLSGTNLPVVYADDGVIVSGGTAIIRCRDGHLIRTLTRAEWTKRVNGLEHIRDRFLLGIQESVDGGKTWSAYQIIRPPGTAPAIFHRATYQNDLVELEDGRILALIRPSSLKLPVAQTYLTRTGLGQYKATPAIWTRLPALGMPEAEICPDGVLWYWGNDGHWYSRDNGRTWHRTQLRFPSYQGKMLATGRSQLLNITQHPMDEAPYPDWHNATIRQCRFSYRRSGIMEQEDPNAVTALAILQGERSANLHLRVDVRCDSLDGLAFGVQPEGRSYHVFAVMLPRSELYDRWFPAEMNSEELRAAYSTEGHFVPSRGYPMAVIARIDNGEVTVLRGIKLRYFVKGTWAPMQVKVIGDLIQGAIKCGTDPNEVVYIEVRDSRYSAGRVGLFTAGGTGAFKNFSAWSAPQIFRYLWR